MTTSGGLYRYDIQDVVRCVGFVGQAPLIEFLNKGKNFSNLTGEKLSEHQAIRAVKKSFADLGLPLDTFTLTPVMDQQPRYVLLVEHSAHHGRVDELAHRVQSNLAAVNEEYGDKCSSGRLLPVQVREVARGTWNSLRHERTSDRGNFEEYKHPCLVGDISFAERIADLTDPPALAASTSALAQPSRLCLYSHEHDGFNHRRDGHGRSPLRAARGRGRLPVQAMVRANSDRRILDGVPVEFVVADLAEPESFPAALADAEIVIHTAAHVGDWGPAEKYRALNVVALEHLIHAAAQHGNLRRWIQVSSLGVYPGPASLRHGRDGACQSRRTRRLHAHQSRRRSFCSITTSRSTDSRR